MKLEERAKIYGIIGTLLFYVALFLLLWFWVLVKQEPEEEQGLSVAIGVDDEGGNDFFEPAPASEIEQLLAALDAEPLSTDVEEFQTQDLEESVDMQVKKEKTPEELQRERERQEELRKIAEAKAIKEEQDRKAEEIGNRTRNLFGGSGAGGAGNSNTSTGQGTGQSNGSQGNPFGSPDAADREGIGGAGSSNGHSYSLAGRSLRGELIRPTYTVYEEGKIVVTIIVDKSGAVVNATVGSGTNIDNPTLRKAAIEAAKRTKFNPINSEKNQSGTITYTFKLQ